MKDYIVILEGGTCGLINAETKEEAMEDNYEENVKYKIWGEYETEVTDEMIDEYMSKQATGG